MPSEVKLSIKSMDGVSVMQLCFTRSHGGCPELVFRCDERDCERGENEGAGGS